MATREGRLPSLPAGHASAAVVLALLVALTLPASSAAAAAGQFTAADVAVTSPNGKLTSLTVAPSGTVSYWGLEQPPTATTIEVQILVDGTWETIQTQSYDVSTLAGSLGYSVPETSVIDQTSGGLVASDFDAQSKDQPTTTTVDMRVVATFAGAGENGRDVTTTSSSSFDVTVSQEPGTGGGNGGGNAGGNGGGNGGGNA